MTTRTSCFRPTRCIHRLALLAGGLAAAASTFDAARADGQGSLIQLERQIERAYPDVQSVLPQKIGPQGLEIANALVLDVRERHEYQVSHVPGAVHVDPDMTAEEFVQQFADRARGRPVVLYCTVGMRSAELAQRLSKPARAAGAIGVYNLRGGILARHNYGLRLEREGRATDHVHPYSSRWSRYLDFPEYARTRLQAH